MGNYLHWNKSPKCLSFLISNNKKYFAWPHWLFVTCRSKLVLDKWPASRQKLFAGLVINWWANLRKMVFRKMVKYIYKYAMERDEHTETGGQKGWQFLQLGVDCLFFWFHESFKCELFMLWTVWLLCYGWKFHWFNACVLLKKNTVFWYSSNYFTNPEVQSKMKNLSFHHQV